MKKKFKKIACAALAFAVVLSLGACSEWTPEGSGPTKTTGTGVAIGEGNGGGVAEVTVILDGYSRPEAVRIDEFFSPVQAASTTEEGGERNPTVGATVDYAPGYIYQYIKIGDKVFEADVNGGKAVYKQVNAAAGETPVDDLAAYVKQPGAPMQWYYDALNNKQAWGCKKDGDAYVTGDALTSKYGSLRKRYSTYWSTETSLSGSQLGFEGNMVMLENYFLAYGFEGLDSAVNGADGSKFITINGVTTGATLSGAGKNYLTAAKAAYDQALAAQKDL